MQFCNRDVAGEGERYLERVLEPENNCGNERPVRKFFLESWPRCRFEATSPRPSSFPSRFPSCLHRMNSDLILKMRCVLHVNLMVTG